MGTWEKWVAECHERGRKAGYVCGTCGAYAAHGRLWEKVGWCDAHWEAEKATKKTEKEAA